MVLLGFAHRMLTARPPTRPPTHSPARHAQRDPQNLNVTLHREMATTLEHIEHYNESLVHWRECAVRSLNQGKLEDAKGYFKEALRVIPDRCDIRYWMGKLHQQELATLTAKLAKKKDTPRRRKRKAAQLLRAVEAFEYCATPRCTDSLQACLGELVQIMPQLMMPSSKTPLNEIVPELVQAGYSERFATHLESIANEYTKMLKGKVRGDLPPDDQQRQAWSASQMYQRTGIFHRIRAGAMFAMLGKVEEAVVQFRVLAESDHNGFLREKGYIKCISYHWLAAGLHALYKASGDEDMLTDASRAEGAIAAFPETVRMDVQDVMGELDMQGNQAELSKMMKASLADPSLLVRDN
jgi:hypothetical protein